LTALDDYRAFLREGLATLEAASLRRRLGSPFGLDLSSNDFLGLADDPRLIAAMQEALPELGAGATGSRLLRGNQPVFERLEERLAAFCGAEAALLFSSGYAANVGLMQALLGSDDIVLSDEHNHASLIDGMRLSGAKKFVYPHQDLDAVDAALQAPRHGGRVFIATESVFGMDGDQTPLAELAALAEDHGALLIVDEAHATGLYGLRGAGRVEELGLRDRVLATVHTGGKGLGAGGAWVAGSGELRDHLINRARSFVFSTAPLPVLAAALFSAVDIVEHEPQRRSEVQRKSALLRSALLRAGARTGGDSPIVPLFVGDNAAAMQLQERLRTEGFDVRAIRPPTVPAGTARLRLVVRYPIADVDLERFALAVERASHALEPAR
jgi:8-amino-7-oxononanoate synthase